MSGVYCVLWRDFCLYLTYVVFLVDFLFLSVGLLGVVCGVFIDLIYCVVGTVVFILVYYELSAVYCEIICVLFCIFYELPDLWTYKYCVVWTYRCSLHIRVLCELKYVVFGEFGKLLVVYNRVDFQVDRWVYCGLPGVVCIVDFQVLCVFKARYWHCPAHLFLLAIPHHVNVRLLPCPNLVTKSCHHISEEKTGSRSQEPGARSQELGARS